MEREGGGFITKTLFFIIIVGLLLYSGINLGSPWFKYYSFKDRLKEISLYESTGTKDQVIDRIMSAANERGVPINKEDIKMEKSGDRGFKILAEWDHEVSLFGGNITKVFHFSVDTSEL